MPTIDPEDSIVHFTYDALGRLIAKQAPWPLVAGEIRTEIYLHDGVRRIQEIWRQPATGNGSQGGQNQNNGPPTYVDITEREYVHSPGYIDEFVCEISTDGPDTFWWVLQDPNYNVVALVSDGDGSGGASSGGTYRGEVARQYSWSPYGELLRADIYDTSAPMSRLGHQGLFHDRMDADILSEPMVAFSRHAAQNRNRTLLAWLARFAQRDPNGTGLPLLAVMHSHGSMSTARILAAQPTLILSDGMNAYGYLSSKPLGATDPSGLSILAGFMSTSTVRTELKGAEAKVALGGLDAMRVFLAQNLARYYAQLYGVADGILVEFSGFGLGGAAGGVGLIASVENLGGRNTGMLMEFAGETFRHNLSTLTRFSGRIGNEILQAHHLIPQEFRNRLARLGVNVDNPIFGQWVEEGAHAAIHADGYNAMWGRFVTTLEREGIHGDDAYDRIVGFIVKISDDYGFIVPFP